VAMNINSLHQDPIFHRYKNMRLSKQFALDGIGMEERRPTVVLQLLPWMSNEQQLLFLVLETRKAQNFRSLRVNSLSTHVR
jgi:hypothetical protein